MEDTITLSCGRLTTGVTVKEWTAVMLLSGSSGTAATGYMQTIFRAQSAGSIDGKQKTTCYAFDFAPDRTLKVLAEVHKIQRRSVGTDDDGRVKMGEFLNFCPVLAEGDSGMDFLDVPTMMKQLKRVTVDAAVKSGFDDDSIYRADAGIVMDQRRVELMEKLKARLTPQKKSPKVTGVTINDHGLTDEEYQKAQSAKHKPKKERTPEEKAALEREREMKKKQQALFDLLRNVSIRLPLLIYGTATEFDASVRLEEFIDIVDDESWKEFMPKDVDKDLFRGLLVFYDADVIEGAGMRIRRMAKAADELMPTQRVLRIAEIFSYFRNPAKETVLTPWRVVNMHMGDTIGGYTFYKDGYPEKDGLRDEPVLLEQGEVTADLFLNENVKILEMNSKSGLYPLYLAYSIYRMLLPKAEKDMSMEEAQEIWQKALRDHLFVLCQTTMAVSITRRTLAGYRDVPVNAIYLTQLLKRMEDKPRLAKKLTNPATWGREGERMKFDAIVGNPPYQLMGASGGTNDAPIYQSFVQSAFATTGRYVSLIIPSRWFTTGRENLLGEFRQEMLQSRKLRQLTAYANPNDVFTSVDLKGGLCYFLYDRQHEGPCFYTLNDDGQVNSAYRELGDFDILIRDPRVAEIVRKVMVTTGEGNAMVSSLVSGDTPFGIPTNPLSSKKGAIDVLDEADDTHDTQLVYLLDMVRTVGYVSAASISKHKDDIYRHKVFIPEAAGSGNDPYVLGKPMYAAPNSVCSQTFLYVAFDTRDEANNFITYLQTKFFRVLVSACKISQHAPSKAYRFVPIQDFTRSWSDEELYSMYGLTAEDIKYIEDTIQPLVLADA